MLAAVLVAALWSIANLVLHFTYPAWCIFHSHEGEIFVVIAAPIGLVFLIKPIVKYGKAGIADFFKKRKTVSGIITSLEQNEDYSGESRSVSYILSMGELSLKISKTAWYKLKKGDHVQVTFTPELKEVWEINKINS